MVKPHPAPTRQGNIKRAWKRMTTGPMLLRIAWILLHLDWANEYFLQSGITFMSPQWPIRLKACFDVIPLVRWQFSTQACVNLLPHEMILFRCCIFFGCLPQCIIPGLVGVGFANLQCLLFFSWPVRTANAFQIASLVILFLFSPSKLKPKSLCWIIPSLTISSGEDS